ncbi:MAG: PaaX family transcriptional regulator C-terminal domain-containing protein [Pseudomonadota bacterium]
MCAELNSLFHQFITDNRPKAGSLIISLFGDVISQHGNNVWLGSVIECLTPFGQNSRQIRTAISRLVQEQWLESTQRGRRSYYGFTTVGLRRFERVANRIYAGQLPDWNRQWVVVILTMVDAAYRDAFRRELLWQGFGQVNAETFVHPSADQAVLNEIIADFNLGAQVIVMRASSHELTSKLAIQNLTYKAWKLAEVQNKFEQFCAYFEKVQSYVNNSNGIGSANSFRFRLLLVHEYRRLLLKTTALPRDLLPESWLGNQALDIAAYLYRQCEPGSVRYIAEAFESLNGSIAPPATGYYSRFKAATAA